MKRNLIIYLVLLLACLSPMQAQKAISTQEQVIENKIRLNELEKKVADQEQEMKSSSDKKQNDLYAKLELKKENLEYKNNWVNYLLAILGILITFFGIGIPIAAVYYGRKFYSEIEEEKGKAKAELEVFKKDFKDSLGQLIINSKERVQLLEEKAQVSIANLCKYEKDGKNARDRIAVIKKEFETLNNSIQDSDLSIEKKENLVIKAQELGNEEGISEYEKEYAKALELYYLDDHQKALDKFELILNLYPNKVTLDKLCDIYFNIAYLYGKLVNIKKAIEFNRKVIAINPHYIKAWYNLGVINNVIKEYDESLSCYQKVLSIQPDDILSLNNIGTLYDIKKDYNTAITYYKQATDKDPNFSLAWINMGNSLFKIGEKEKAIECLQKAITAQSNNADAWYSMGIISEEDDKKIECYKKTVEFDNKYISAYLNLIELLIVNLNFKDAENYLNIAKINDLEPDFVLSFLGVINSVFQNKWNKNVNETFETLKEITENDSSSINWSFNLMKNSLATKSPLEITIEQSEFISELIRLIEEWIVESKKS